MSYFITLLVSYKAAFPVRVAKNLFAESKRFGSVNAHSSSFARATDFITHIQTCFGLYNNVKIRELGKLTRASPGISEVYFEYLD